MGHVSCAVRRQTPLAPEVALVACLRMRGDQRDEQPAVVNLLSDLAVPGISAPQLALVEPDLDAGRPKRIADPPRGLGVL